MNGLSLLFLSAAVGSLAVSERPVPIGNPGDWIGENDYPAEARRLALEGITGFALTIDRAGAVIRCDVTMPSGSPLLDVTTCTLLQNRARFQPAHDGRGRPVVSRFSSRVRWQMPDKDTPEVLPAIEPFSLVVAMDVGPDGAVQQCKVLWNTLPRNVPQSPCEDAATLAHFTPFAGPDGKPVAKRVTYRMSATVEDLSPASVPGAAAPAGGSHSTP